MKGQKWGKSIKMIYTTIIRFVTNRNQIYKRKKERTLKKTNNQINKNKN